MQGLAQRIAHYTRPEMLTNPNANRERTFPSTLLPYTWQTDLAGRALAPFAQSEESFAKAPALKPGRELKIKTPSPLKFAHGGNVMVTDEPIIGMGAKTKQPK